MSLAVAATQSQQFKINSHWSLVIGHWSLVIGHWSLVIGHLSFVIGHLSLVILCVPASSQSLTRSQTSGGTFTARICRAF
ncbi:hypothetical protein [Nostoc sp.]|uniref:hypothetical protein n=1 Tax=Nostoc sp. TaxID=1180 RepID=UPI002FEEEBFC